MLCYLILNFKGKSHLASVRICGNKGYPIREPASHRDECYDPARVRNEIQYLSHYMKNRRAAADKENRGVVMESGKFDVFPMCESLSIMYNFH